MMAGWLSRLFGSGGAQLPDYATFRCDMHSHFIPGIDDGAATLEDSIALIRGMRELGFAKLITTPHIMSDFYRNTPETILGGLELVRAELKRLNIDVELHAAAEYYIDAGFQELLENGNLLTFGGKYLLVEISYINYPENFKEVLFQIKTSGYYPVLAHPERYPFWLHNFDDLREIKMAGTYLQINTNSLSGYYGPEARHMAERLIDENMVDFIGSDVHNIKHLDGLRKTLRSKHLARLAEGELINKAL